MNVLASSQGVYAEATGEVMTIRNGADQVTFTRDDLINAALQRYKDWKATDENAPICIASDEYQWCLDSDRRLDEDSDTAEDADIEDDDTASNTDSYTTQCVLTGVSRQTIELYPADSPKLVLVPTEYTVFMLDLYCCGTEDKPTCEALYDTGEDNNYLIGQVKIGLADRFQRKSTEAYPP